MAVNIENKRGLRKRQHGVVVSNKMDKTVVVQVKRKQRHPIYKKVYSSNKKFKAHDEKNECKIGDEVIIMEIRPLSRTKCWRVMEIIKQKR